MAHGPHLPGLCAGRPAPRVCSCFPQLQPTSTFSMIINLPLYSASSNSALPCALSRIKW